MENTRALEGNLWKYQLYSIFTDPVTMAVPIIVLFWQNNGLSITDIMILQSIFSIIVVLLEVPSGYFADIHGRKTSLVLGGIAMSLGIGIYSFAASFSTFLIAEIAIAFSISLFSGADSALVYDSLKGLKREKTFKKVWGNIVALSLVGMIFFNLSGGFLAEVNLRLPFFVAFFISLLATPIALSMHEPKRHKRIFKKGYTRELFSILKNEVLSNKALRMTVFFAALLFSLFHSGLWLYNPYFELIQLDIVYFGLAFASFNAVAALSAKFTHIWEPKLGKKWSFVLLFLIVGLSYLFMSTFTFVLSFMFIFGFQFVRGANRVVIDDYIHAFTSSDIRATVMSVSNMSSRLFYALLLPFIGVMVDVYTLTQALYVLGITSLVIGAVMLVTLHMNKMFD
jgi:MFS family permease